MRMAAASPPPAAPSKSARTNTSTSTMETTTTHNSRAYRRHRHNGGNGGGRHRRRPRRRRRRRHRSAAATLRVALLGAAATAGMMMATTSLIATLPREGGGRDDGNGGTVAIAVRLGIAEGSSLPQRPMSPPSPPSSSSAAAASYRGREKRDVAAGGGAFPPPPASSLSSSSTRRRQQGAASAGGSNRRPAAIRSATTATASRTAPRRRMTTTTPTTTRRLPEGTNHEFLDQDIQEGWRLAEEGGSNFQDDNQDEDDYSDDYRDPSYYYPYGQEDIGAGAGAEEEEEEMGEYEPYYDAAAASAGRGRERGTSGGGTRPFPNLPPRRTDSVMRDGTGTEFVNEERRTVGSGGGRTNARGAAAAAAAASSSPPATPRGRGRGRGGNSYVQDNDNNDDDDDVVGAYYYDDDVGLGGNGNYDGGGAPWSSLNDGFVDGNNVDEMDHYDDPSSSHMDSSRSGRGRTREWEGPGRRAGVGVGVGRMKRAQTQRQNQQNQHQRPRMPQRDNNDDDGDGGGGGGIFGVKAGGGGGGSGMYQGPGDMPLDDEFFDDGEHGFNVGDGDYEEEEGGEISSRGMRFGGGGGKRGVGVDAGAKVEEEERGVEENTSEKDALYEAYNLLHTLAQDFKKPFDAPAVVVVGHQSSGKSALIEALMGFQFNQVGGGTKTRRPVALRMQYDPDCHQPRCYLVDDDGVERPKTLSEIQHYIESENRRLERDPVRCFDPREINVRMEYKYCPNMILIDTPGLISAPRMPKGRAGAPGAAGQAAMQQRALLASAKEAERLVVSKMRCPDYLILCVEDTMDWKHGATREIVQKADPDLSRTIIVNTKLDTKVPQFGNPSDLADYLRADIIDRLSPHKLGGPFFTSVPSGRVGRPEDYSSPMYNADGFLFHDDEDFVSACAENEEADREIILRRLRNYSGPAARAGLAGRLDDAAAAAGGSAAGSSFAPPGSPLRSLVPRIGLNNLKTFLERRVDDCYRRNVAKILPLLQSEHAECERRVESIEKELDSMSAERLRAGADVFCDEFCAALREAVEGSVTAPYGTFGETLDMEVESAGSFNDVQGCPMAVSGRTWDRLLTTEVGNRQHRLYGGSQYHRALREFHLASRCLRLPTITEDEIANAAGVGDTHDGVNFLRASCVIALEKARTSFDPLLEALRMRMAHVMGRLYPVGEYMLRQKRERNESYAKYRSKDDGNVGTGGAADITQNAEFRELVRTIFDKFIENCSRSTMRSCQEDLTAMTRFVTWDLQERSAGALRRSLPDQTDIVSVYQVAVKASEKSNGSVRKTRGGGTGIAEKGSTVGAGKGAIVRHGGSASRDGEEEEALMPMADQEAGGDSERDYYNLLQLMEEAACSRDANRTNLVVGGLVQHIVAGWRLSFGRTVTTKFNCYFLLPFIEEFHRFLREELRKVYEGEKDRDVFDLGSARRALRQQKEELLNECRANKRLQEKFESASRMMHEQQERAERVMTGLSASSSQI